MNRIDSLFQLIAKHGPFDPEVEALLGCALAVIIVGAYEDEVEDAFGTRAARASDKELEQFVRETLDGSFRTPSYANITDILKRLDGRYKDRFAATFVDPEVTDLNSLITLRHDIAHRGKVSANLADVERYYKSTVNIVRKLEQAMR